MSQPGMHPHAGATMPRWHLSLRWKMLGSFAGVFTVVFVFIAFWVYLYVGNNALARLESQLAASSAGGASTMNADAFARLVDTVPSVPDPDHSSGLGYPDSALYTAVATQLLHIRKVVVEAGVYSYYRDPDDGKLYFAASAGYLLNPQTGARFRQPVAGAVPPGTYALMEKGLRATTSEPAYSDQFGSWISAYSPILTADGKSVGAIGLDYPLTYVDTVQSQVQRQLFPVLGLAYLVLLVLVLILSTSLARPLKRLTVATQRIAEGEYDLDLSDVSRSRFPDEMWTLSQSFAVMAERVAQREQSLTQEVRRLTVEIDHARREEAVREITETDFFADLTARAAEMRRRVREDPAP